MSEDNKTPENNKDKKERMIMISEKQMSNLMNRLDKLENGDKPLAEKIEESEVRLRLFCTQYVIGFDSKIWKEEDKLEKEMIEWVRLILTNGNKDKDGKIKTNIKKTKYLDFLRDAEQVKCKVVKTTRKKRIEKNGIVEVKEVGTSKENQYRMTGTGVDVPVQVISFDELITIRTPQNVEIEMDANFVNI